MLEPRIDPTAQNLIAHALEAGEELVWAGRPDPASLMRQARRVAVIVILVVLGGVIYGLLARGEGWVWFTWTVGGTGGAIAALIVWSAAAGRGSAYGLTRRRAILYVPGPVNSSTDVVEIAEILDPPRVKDLGDGTARVTLKLGEKDTEGDTVFEAIHDAHEVVALIQQLRADSVTTW